MVTFLKLLPQAQQQQQIAPHLIRRSNQQLRSRMEATRKQRMKTPMMSFMTISGLNLRVCTLRSSKGWNCCHMAQSFWGRIWQSRLLMSSPTFRCLHTLAIIQYERVALAVILGNMNQFVCA